jgi:hypothetical protein
MRRLTIVASLVVLAASFAPLALAQGQGQGKGKGKGEALPTVYGITLAVISPDENNDGPNFSDSVRINVSSNATTNAFVTLMCYQGTSLVYANGGYPAGSAFTLASGAWTSGAAECTATAYTTVDGTKSTTLGTLSFHVGA